MKQKILNLLLFVLLPTCAQATLEEADEAYMRGEYESAAQLYEEVLTEGGNADAYYNLGNAYYRMEDLGHAVLNYERALLLAPDNEDVQFNLALAQSRVIDQFNSPSEMFFITWVRDLVKSKEADQWGYWGIFFFVIAILSFLVYRIAASVGLRKVSFFLSLACLIVAILVNVAAAWYSYSFDNDQRAVIVRETSLFASNNGKETPLRELHPGTTLEVIDENSRGWIEVLLTNGKKGWMKRTDAVNIVQ